MFDAQEPNTEEDEAADAVAEQQMEQAAQQYTSDDQMEDLTNENAEGIEYVNPNTSASEGVAMIQNAEGTWTALTPAEAEAAQIAVSMAQQGVEMQEVAAAEGITAMQDLAGQELQYIADGVAVPLSGADAQQVLAEAQHVLPVDAQQVLAEVAGQQVESADGQIIAADGQILATSEENGSQLLAAAGQVITSDGQVVTTNGEMVTGDGQVVTGGQLITADGQPLDGLPEGAYINELGQIVLPGTQVVQVLHEVTSADGTTQQYIEERILVGDPNQLTQAV